MNTPFVPSGLTPYQLIGRLAGLYRRGVEASNLGLVGLESWTSRQFRDRCRDVEDLQAHLNALGCPGDHPWRGVNRTEPILHSEFREFFDGLADVVGSLESIDNAGANLATSLGLMLPDEFHLKDAYQVAQFAVRLVNAPPMDRTRNRGSRLGRRYGPRSRGCWNARELWRTLFTAINTLVWRNCAINSPEPGHRAIIPAAESGDRARGPHRDMDGPLTQISKSVESLKEILVLSRQLEESYPWKLDRTQASGKSNSSLNLLSALSKLPRMDRGQIDHPVWETRQAEVAEIVKQGQALRASRTALESKISDVAWSTDLAGTRRHLAAYGRSLFRWFNGGYREAVVTFKGIVKGEPPRRLSDRLDILDAVISVKCTSQSMDDDPSIAQAGLDAFGSEWRGARSDWEVLALIVAWDSAGRRRGSIGTRTQESPGKSAPAGACARRP